MRKPDHLTCLLKNLYAGQEATVKTEHGNRLVTNWERSMPRLYIVTLFNLYAAYMCEMLGWMKLKLESRLPGEISITDMQMTPPLWQKVKRN